MFDMGDVAHFKHTLLIGMATACGLMGIFASQPALAERLSNKVAVFSALDKVTARISKIEIALGETKRFGSLEVTPRVCYSRPPTEKPKTTSFVQVQEVQIDGTEKPIFSGWMFAESPGLNAVEHPVFDVWLTGCESPVNTASRGDAPQTAGRVPDGRAAEPQPTEQPHFRRRVRR